MDLYDIAVARKLSGGGGGGSSDFSTAEVTIINNGQTSQLADVPVIYDANELGEGSPAGVWTMPVVYEGSNTITVPLYKGAAILLNDPRYTITSGAAETILEGNCIKITGDCTITIS